MKKILTTLLLLFAFVSLSAQSFREWADSLGTVTGFAPVGGNSVFFTKSGEEFFASVLRDVREARESINMEYYWIDNDPVGREFRDALIEKAREGVKVRVLFDNLVTPLSPELFFDKMRKAGIEVLPAHDLKKMSLGKSISTVFLERDHRKIIVIDHRIGYTGGINFFKPAVYEWSDFAVRVEGPGAASMEHLVEEGWEHPGGTPFEVVPAKGAGPVELQVVPGRADPMSSEIYAQALRHARKYFYIQTPYFVPPQNVLDAIKDAARRGVDIRLLMTKSDHAYMDELAREYYEELLALGIRISVTQGHFDHSKTFVADGTLFCCGSQNLDMRSFNINLEDGLYFYDESLARNYTRHFLGLESEARQALPGENVAKGFRKAWRKFVGLFAPLL